MKLELKPDRMLVNSVLITEQALKLAGSLLQQAQRAGSTAVDQFSASYARNNADILLREKFEEELSVKELEHRLKNVIPFKTPDRYIDLPAQEREAERQRAQTEELQPRNS